MQQQRHLCNWPLALLVVAAIGLAGCAVSPAPGSASNPSADQSPAVEPGLCDPKNPVLTPPDWDGIISEPEDAQARRFFQTEVIYKNQVGQTFRLTISGRLKEVLEEFVAPLQLCFEAVPHSDDVQRIYTPEGIDFSVDHPLEDEFREDAETLAADFAAFESGASSFSTILFDLPNPNRNIVMQMAWIDAPGNQEQKIAIYYAIHPLINAGVWHGYLAECDDSGWAQISASAGQATVHIWRYSPNYVFIHHRTAEVGGTNPTPWIGSNTPNSTYDVGVNGRQDGSDYTIFGGWVLGAGGEFC
jgi:hypothetical protein